MGLPPGPSIAPSVAVDLDDGLGEGLGCLLGQVVPDAALDHTMHIFSRELLGIGAAVGVWCTIGITFKGDRGHGDDRTFGKPLLQIVIVRLAFSQSQTPAVVMDDDADMIRVVERRRAAIKLSVIEVPFRRSCTTNKLRKIVPISIAAGSPTFRGEIILVPPLELGRWRQRPLVGFRAADQIATHRNHGLAALRPQRRDDVGRSRAPIKTGEDRLLDLQRIHQRDGVDRERRLLAIPERRTRKKARRAVAAQVRHDHPVARRRQHGRDLDVAMDVVGPAVQQHDRRTVGGAGLGVANIQDAGIDLLQGDERCVHPRCVSAHRRLLVGEEVASAQLRAWTAFRIRLVTACGWETMITCEPSTSTMSAPARWAMERTTSLPAALSPVATTAQDGSVFQAGGPDASVKAEAATGRWVAAITAVCSAGRSAANASRNRVGLMANSTAVSPSWPVGYWRWTRAVLRMLSVELPSTSPRRSLSSGAKAATKTRPTTPVAVAAALVITAPP